MALLRPMQLTPGQFITQNLRLVRPIGRGGMGTVWVAYHQTLGSEVAIKCIDPHLVKSNPASIERFNREAGIAARLKNPHVAHTYDHGMLEDGTPYIVMELLEGESLQDHVKRRGRLSLHETSLVISQTAQALGKAHKLKIVHRDVKPANLFCVETDYDIFIKLLDFGIAKHSGGVGDVSLTNTTGMLGSPLYMSPEQFDQPRGVDWRADLWSLAVVGYQCLTGHAPFRGESLARVIMAVMDRNYTPVTHVQPGLPPALDAWFERAFHRNIDHRHQSAKELGLSFVAIARDGAANSVDRPPIPSITDMSNSGANSAAGSTAPAMPRGTEVLDAGAVAAMAAGHTASDGAAAPSQPALPPWMQADASLGQTATLDATPRAAVTFAPASTTIDAPRRRVRWMLGLGGAGLLLMGGLAGVAVFATGDGGAPLRALGSAVPADEALALPPGAGEEPGSDAVDPATEPSASASAAASASSATSASASASAQAAASASASAATASPPPQPPRPRPPYRPPRPRPDLDGAGF